MTWDQAMIGPQISHLGILLIGYCHPLNLSNILQAIKPFFSFFSFCFLLGGYFSSFNE